MGDDSINLVFSVDFCQSLLVKSRHLIRPVASRLGGMRPRISSMAIGPVNADGSANAEDRMTASRHDAVVRDTTEAFVVNALLLEIRRVIVVAANHRNPIISLGQSTRYLCGDLLIVTRPLEAKTAVSGNDEQSVRHPVLNAQLEHHLLEVAVDVSANNETHIGLEVFLCFQAFFRKFVCNTNAG